MRTNKFSRWLTVGAVVLAATVGTTLLITKARLTAAQPEAPGSTTVQAVQAARPSSTTITLEVTPASSADPITTETLTATLTPATVTGVVQFNDASIPLDDPVTPFNGSATTTTTLPAGDHSLTADFTPTDATLFSGSI